ncbi:unnamed protein product [Chrysodeixis includens]|uniref:RRM domain-containing protein n=1 Tax=Chrysodeixis includens TaxID=689277 RepID=A0A9P0BZ83_CHRIL|nr:unnamed protein product [Chrysodeixis includens]
MKSKSFDLTQATTQKHSFDKTSGFAGLYKSAGESYTFEEKHKSDEIAKKETLKNKTVTSKRERSPNKNKKKIKQDHIDLPQVIIDGASLTNPELSTASAGRRSSASDPKVTSTPNTTGKNQSGKVKSIMKTKTSADESFDSARSNVSSGKPKKRNKSVSFMLDDHEEVVVKRTKSDDSIKVNKKSVSAPNVKDKRKNSKKLKKDNQSEKENKAADVNNQMDVDSQKSAKLNKTKKFLGATSTSHIGGDGENRNHEVKEKKKKLKKVKKLKSDAGSEVTDTETNNNEVVSDSKSKKPRKKKQAKPLPADITEGGDEPAAKSRKKEPKPDIAEDLENLSIGDNAHTLTNLLDEMTVVDKNKRKKLKSKFNKKKKLKGHNSSKEDTETGEEVKEKVKWKKRKWNKDKKGDADDDSLANTVIVENLPISIMLNYRKLLTELFLKYGLIRKIGIAEVYPTQESKPVFTTTISFILDGAAEQALKEDDSHFEGSRIRVKRALPASQTTVVVRSYADLTDQALSTLFLGAGKIRSIRHLVKGKKTMSTAFVEFDGPESVDRAIKTAGDAKIGGKKIHLSKFELRGKKIKKHKNDGDSAADADSEDSND